MPGRIRRVLLKQARRHIAFERNEPRLDEPDRPLATMTPDQRERFEADDAEHWRLAGWPEVGTRSMQRLLVVGDQVFQDRGS
jgi:hypothetical protein